MFRLSATDWTPMVVHSRADLTPVLVALRKLRRETGETFDARAGWADRYTAKLEKPETPTGKEGFHIYPPGFGSTSPFCGGENGRIAMTAMAEVWLEALGARLVLMPADLADKIGAVPAPLRAAA